MMNARELVKCAFEAKTVIPAFNIPFLPMVKPIVQAVCDENSIAMLQVARVEWEKFGSESLEAVAEEYKRYADPKHTLLHLDHIPAIDEDSKEVDYMEYIKRGASAGYQSMMIDASRLNLDGNIKATKKAVDFCHSQNLPCEAELGAVMGHESGSMMPYEEIFKTKKGFTNLEEAKRFVAETDCDWLSVAVGSIHGAVAENLKFQKKPEARLDIDHIKALAKALKIPLVLHGGSGINYEFIQKGIAAGIAKINVGTEIRQAYLKSIESDDNVEKAQQAVYDSVVDIIRNMLKIQNTRLLLY